MDLNETLQSLPPVSHNMVHSLCWRWLVSVRQQQETDAGIMLILEQQQLFGELDKLFSLFLASRKEISKRFMS